MSLSFSSLILYICLSASSPFSFSSPSSLLPKTVLGVELRLSRDSLFWHWRNNGTSAASDVEPATWSSLESTSASECEHKHKDSQWGVSYLQKASKQTYCTSHPAAVWFLLSTLQGWSAILWGRLPRPVRGEMWDLQQIHQRKSSGGEKRTRYQHLMELMET